MSANNLNGKSVFVSGSSRGIGAATVKLFADAGAKVAINYRDKEVRAQKVAEEIRARGGEAIVLKADLTDYQTVTEARDAIRVAREKAKNEPDPVIEMMALMPWLPSSL